MKTGKLIAKVKKSRMVIRKRERTVIDVYLEKQLDCRSEPTKPDVFQKSVGLRKASVNSVEDALYP